MDRKKGVCKSRGRKHEVHFFFYIHNEPPRLKTNKESETLRQRNLLIGQPYGRETTKRPEQNRRPSSIRYIPQPKYFKCRGERPFLAEGRYFFILFQLVHFISKIENECGAQISKRKCTLFF